MHMGIMVVRRSACHFFTGNPMDILQRIINGIAGIITNALTIGATPIGDRRIAVMTTREKNTAMGTATPMTEGPPTIAAAPIAVMAGDIAKDREPRQVGHARQRPGASDQKG
jgi:hypothetical protein